MTTPKDQEGISVTLLYYLFAFILLWEWLRPLGEFTDTANTFIFVFFIAVSFVMTFFRLRWFITFPVKMLIILFMLHGLYFEGMFFSFLWVKDLIGDIAFNLSLVPSAEWMGMTSSFRSLLFFILLWLLVYLIHYWILFQKRIFFFFVLTLLYITVLDTFTPYDASYAIVRVVLIGFFMLGLLYFDRLKKLENLKMKKLASLRWIMPLLAFIMLSMILAILAPKASPQWPDPVPYITAVGREDEGGTGTKKIGYSPNDENLGGSFVGDDTEVFTHISSDRHYWRVESKDVYTGKGWEASDPDAERELITSIQDEVIWTDERVETKSLESTVTINEEYRYLHVIYPLGLTAISTEVNLPIYLNRNTELISPFQKQGDGSREEFLTYQVEYELPSYPLNEMKKAQVFENVPEGFVERYTQLPETLPERVRELAVSLTETESNQYDKVKAIEDYLGRPEFTYDKEDVAIPEGEQDYVDQFLFETFKGYCDNFSTSMIVLLRSLDIPARWVKGYTEGDFVQTVENSKSEYQVTNNNAHSWVEVYFAGVGWVPFEPTKGFVNPYDLVSDYKDTPGQEEVEEEKEPVEEEEKEPEATPEKPEQTNTETSSSTNDFFGFFSLRLGSTGLYGFMIVTAILAFVIFKTRTRWIPKLIILKYKNRNDDQVFFQAYESLLKQFARRGIKRKEGQTLRDYARYIDRYFHMVHMTALTENYERALYRRDDAKQEWNKSVELWENLIKRTSS
ncbi:transglutaminase domain-containing protein [Metabacillus sp. B2-18]|uniref:transglutaminase domain-containing protein n=1 Tax=Metabacillus sp. B2-18 TaxID=2897333 RepID=UPI001E574BCE|nr:transglutaminase domain-containing protein [Metabacillus sp. B2-18]UGB31253.1 transglutaminase domain-containing protein [Metabacillus sp. B2-18]